MKVSVILLLCIVLFTIPVLFFQQSEAIRIPTPEPTSNILCDPNTFVTIVYPRGWYTGAYYDENELPTHSFSPNENVMFLIRTAFFDVEVTPTDVSRALEPNGAPDPNTISEIDASRLIKRLPAVGYTYNYTIDDNIIKGMKLFAINNPIPNQLNAAFQFTFEADSSIYDTYYRQIQTMLASFRSNDGQPC